MTALGHPVLEIAIAASVAGFCWAFFGAAAASLWARLTRLGGR